MLDPQSTPTPDELLPSVLDGIELDNEPSTDIDTDINTDYIEKSNKIQRKLRKTILLRSLTPVIVVLLLVSLFAFWQVSSRPDTDKQFVNQQEPVNQINISKLPALAISVPQGDITELIFNNKIVSNGTIVLSPSLQPAEPTTGQFYYDQTTGDLKLFDGEIYRSILSSTEQQQVCFIGGDCGFLTAADIPNSVELPQDLSINSTPAFANLNLAGELAVTNGGTGASSFSNNALLIGNGTGAVSATNTPAAGQLVVANASGVPQFVSAIGDVVITSTGNTSLTTNSVGTNELVDTGVTAGVYGDGTNYPVFTVNADGRITAAATFAVPGGGGGVGSLNTLTGLLTLQGTSNQVSVVSGSSTITLSTPQDIATSSSPTFNGLTVSSITRGVDTISDFSGSGLQVVGGSLESTLGLAIDSAELTDGTVAEADLNISNTPAGLNGYVLTFNEGTGGFTWVSQGGIVGGGGGDTTPDTIADDGVISDGEAADDLTISASGSVADGALSANVSLLGSAIDLTSEITGTLAVSNGGTGATTQAGARTNLGLGTVAVLNSITTTNITNDTILAVDLDNTTAPTVTEDGYVLTYDNATGGFTWVSQGGIVGGGGGDTTPDTIADDGFISLTTEISGTLAVSNGGTGATTFTTNGLLYGNGTGAIQSLGVGATNQCLLGNTGSAPTWGSCTAGGGGFTNLSLAADSGSSETVSDTDTITIAGGTNINTVVGATDTVTVNLDSAPTITGLLTLTNAGTALSVTNNATIGGTLTVNGTTVEGSDLALIADGTITLGTETTGSFDTTDDNVSGDVDSGEITDGTIQEVDLEATNAAVNTYVLTYDNATGGFTWVSQGGIVGGGGGDTTPDTIADDGVISDGEAADDLTISASGSVADGALSANVSLLGSAIDLTSEITGTLAVSNGGTGATTQAGARTNLGLGTVAVLNSITTTNITNDTILAVDLDNTTAPTVTEDGYVLTYDNATGGFTWVSQGGIVGGGGGDTTPDTIADDGFISLTTEISGTLAVSNGGTGATTFTTNGLLYGNGTGAIQSLGVGATNQCLLGNTGSAPTWGSCTAGGGGFTNLSLAADSGSSETVSDTDTITIAGGTNINTVVGATDTVTVNLDSAPTITGLLTLTNAGTALSVTNNATIGGTLTVNGTTVEGSDLALIADGTITLGTETTGSFDTTDDNVSGDVDSGEITDGTIQEVDLEATNAAVNTYVLTYDNATGGFTWVSQGGIVGGGGGDTTPDTIADDGVISDGEAADDLTISASGSVADGALSANVSLLGSAIDLTSEITGTLAVSNGGTGATTQAGARTNLGLGTVAVLNSITTTNITNDTILAVDLDNTTAPTVTEDGYVLTYDNATGGFTWVSQGGIVGGGGGDTTPDTIADDGFISLTTEISGTLAVSNGGTGATTFTTNGLLYGNGTGAIQSLGVGATNQCLLGNTGSAPTWGSCTAGGGGFTNLSLAADSGSSETVSDTDTITIAGGTNINTVVGATDTVTVNLDSAPTITGLLTLTNAGTALSVTNNATIGGTLTVNGTTVEGSDLALIADGTITLGTETTGSFDTTDDNVSGDVDSGEITDGTIQEVDLEATNAAVNTYVLTYDNATGGFTWVSQGGIVGGGGGDTTPDTIADDGVISDGEAADDLTISASGSVADGALSANVSLLGSAIDLTSEITGTLAVSNGGTGATTQAGARTNLGLGTVAVLNSITTTNITNDTILAVDLDNTTAPTVTEDGYVLTYDNATGGFTWVSQGGIVGGGGGVTALSSIGSTPNANGASISGNTLNLQPASASFGGVVTTAYQEFAGNKLFTDNFEVLGASDFNDNVRIDVGTTPVVDGSNTTNITLYNYVGGTYNLNTVRGIYQEIYANTSGSTNETTAVLAQTGNIGSGTVTDSISFYGNTSNGGGNITNALGADLTVQNSSGNITNAFGIRVNPTSNFGGTITRNAGIAIAEQAVGTNNTNLLIGTTTAPTGQYSIYNASTDANLFNGSLTVDAQITSGDSATAGSLRVSDGSSNYATIDVDALAGNYSVSIPTITADDEFCLLVLGNCAGAGTDDTTITVAPDDASAGVKAAADYVADGTADQSEINSALTAAAGGKVILLAGTFVADGTILIPNNTTLEGEGNGTVVQLDAGSSSDNLIENSDITTGEGVELRNMTLDGTLGTGGNQMGVNFGPIGSIASSRAGVIVENVVAKDFSFAGINVSLNTVNSIFTNNTATNNLTGMYLNVCDTCVVSNNRVTNNTVGIRISVNQNNTVDGNIVNGNVTGILIDSSSTENTISNNAIDNSADYGIRLGSGNPGNNIIIGNTITNSGGTGGNNGIYVGGSDNNSIINNLITDSVCNTTCYAINISDAGSSRNYLSGNRYWDTDATGGDEASINDAGTSTIYANQQTNTISGTAADVTDFRFRGSANSTTAFAVQNAAGASILNADTLNGELEVGASTIITATSSSALTGTADPDGTTTLTGTSTLFLSELQVGDRITINAETRTVTAIASDTSLNVDTAFTDTAAASITRLPASLIVKDSSANISFIVQDNGNVGIGTEAPNYPLEITNGGGSGTYALGLRSTSNSSELIAGINSLGNVVYELNTGAGDDVFYRISDRNGVGGNDLIVVSTQSNEDSIAVDSNSRASIWLDADQNNDNTTDQNAYVAIRQNNGGDAGILGLVQTAGEDSRTNTYNGTIAGALLLGTTSNDVLQLGTNDTVALTVDTSQNTTLAGGLTVNDGARFNDSGSSSGDFVVESDTDPNAFFFDADTGKVSIGGGSNPAYRLQVEGTSCCGGTGGVLKLRNSLDTGYSSIDFYNDSDTLGLLTFGYANDTVIIPELRGSAYLSTGSGTDFILRTNNTQRALFQATGGLVLNEPGNDYDFRVEGNTDSNLLVVDASADSIGIGTSTPDAKLEVVSTTASEPRGVLSSQYSNNVNGAFFQGRKARGTQGTPSAITDGDFGTILANSFYDGNSWENTGFATFKSNGTVADGSVPTDFVLYTGSTNWGEERLRVTSTGNVGIGTSAPEFNLQVVNETTSAYITADGYTAQGVFQGRRANGTPGSESAVLDNQSFAQFSGRGYGATGWSGTSAAIVLRATEDWTDTAQGSSMAFLVTDTGTTNLVSKLTINDYGLDVFDTLNVSKTVAPSSAPVVETFYYGGRFNATTSSANVNSNTILIGSTSNAISSSASIQRAIGQQSSSEINGTGGASLALGGEFTAFNTGSGTINSSAGVRAWSINDSSGTITDARGLVALIANNSSGTITTAKSIEVKNPANTGTLTDNYALYVSDQTAGTNDYGIYVEGAETYALWVDSGATRLDGTLEVQGTTTIQGTGTGDTYIGAPAGCGGAGNWGGIGFAAFDVGCTNYNIIGGDGNLWINRDLGGDIYFREDGSSNGPINQLTIAAGGNIGIADNTPAYKLEVGGGDINTTGGGYRDAGTCVAGTCASDINLKNNVATISNALQKVTSLNPVSYYFNDPINGPGKQYGLIAQEVQNVFPELVSTDPETGYKQVSYGLQLQFYTMAALKELNVQVQSNTATLASLSSTTTNLTKKNLTVTNQTTTSKLVVTGTATINNLKVTGTTEVATLKVDRIISQGNTPTAVLGATTTGQGSTYIIEGNDTAGTIDFTSGTNTITNPLASGEQITVTFDEPFETTPRITLTPLTAEAATLDYFVTRDVDGFKINFVSAPNATTTYSFDYQIIQ